MKPVLFHSDADIEMMEAAAYYEVQQQDLGKRFLSAIQDSINHIRINPHIFPVAHLNTRRCLTKTFPFSVLFRIYPEQIVIVAVMHQHRHPDYWKNRSFEP
ncbi:MAG: type II toxin-antitoxin system RelE/ParE family toxin [Kiritimatiellae bacterium]|nr:type II toxin-antitoxin system RelE/ParE family toxin [Kiritimatiellia bacterium]